MRVLVGDEQAVPSIGERAYSVAARTAYILKRWPVIPGIILFLLLFGAAFAPLLEPYDPLKVDLRERNSPPSWFTDGSEKYFLGGDPVGRDILSRIIESTRITVAGVFFSITVGIVTGTALGLIAGYGGGVVDVTLRCEPLRERQVAHIEHVPVGVGDGLPLAAVADHLRHCRDTQRQGIGRIECRLLVFLHVLGLSQWQRL